MNQRTRVIAVLLLVLVAEARGSTPSVGEGTPDFDVFVQPLRYGEVIDAADSIELLVGVHMMPGAGERQARVHIRPGPGLSWVSGDSVRVTRVPSNAAVYKWTVTLKSVHEGRTEVRAGVVLGKPGNLREMEIALPILTERAGITVQKPRIVREETVQGKQRYRYAGRYLVPIDGPEEVTTADITHGPSIARSWAARCACPDTSSRNLSFAVFVRANGNVHSVRFVEGATGSEGATPELIRCAESTLMAWRFQPARTSTRPVAHWLDVHVPIECVDAPR